MDDNSTTIDLSTYRASGNKEEEEVNQEVKALYNDMLTQITQMLTFFTKLTNVKLSDGTIKCTSTKKGEGYDFSYYVTGNFEPLGE